RPVGTGRQHRRCLRPGRYHRPADGCPLGGRDADHGRGPPVGRGGGRPRRGPLGGETLPTIVFETGRPARFDGYSDVPGTLADDAREAGLRSAVATPITAEGRLWGVIGVGSSLEQPLPADTEARLASFTELVATAIANAESHEALTRLAGGEAGLRGGGAAKTG